MLFWRVAGTIVGTVPHATLQPMRLSDCLRRRDPPDTLRSNCRNARTHRCPTKSESSRSGCVVVEDKNACDVNCE